MVRIVKILGISGSGHKGSFNQALLDAAKEMLPPNVMLETFDVSKFPLFVQDLERSPPPEVRAFKQKIRDSDAILFATPEHNYSITAVLKNAIEWANRPPEDNSWDGKPAAIVSASTSLRGGARAQLHLRQIMVDLNMHPINEPQLMVARAQEAFDANLKLNDEKTKATLKAVVEALVTWAAKLGE
ncbi:MAG: NAD(P)H-dependent oxidoreductase [Nitrososphaerales archaeon]|nr:NAD(P)H-dependent oxidoreductase [Nitrososphaerales archaeon]